MSVDRCNVTAVAVAAAGALVTMTTVEPLIHNRHPCSQRPQQGWLPWPGTRQPGGSLRRRTTA